MKYVTAGVWGESSTSCRLLALSHRQKGSRAMPTNGSLWRKTCPSGRCESGSGCPTPKVCSKSTTHAYQHNAHEVLTWPKLWALRSCSITRVFVSILIVRYARGSQTPWRNFDMVKNHVRSARVFTVAANRRHVLRREISSCLSKALHKKSQI